MPEGALADITVLDLPHHIAGILHEAFSYLRRRGHQDRASWDWRSSAAGRTVSRGCTTPGEERAVSTPEHQQAECHYQSATRPWTGSGQRVGQAGGRSRRKLCAAGVTGVRSELCGHRAAQPAPGDDLYLELWPDRAVSRLARAGHRHLCHGWSNEPYRLARPRATAISPQSHGLPGRQCRGRRDYDGSAGGRPAWYWPAH
jgi:hypothetical protein